MIISVMPEPLKFWILNGKLVRTGDWPHRALIEGARLRRVNKKYVQFCQLGTAIRIFTHDGSATYAFLHIVEQEVSDPVFQCERIA